jgi:hypothetical protein
MVKLRCCLAGCKKECFEVDPLGFWICPHCKMNDTYDVVDISNEEIALIWENYNNIYSHGNIENEGSLYYGILEYTFEGKGITFDANISEHYDTLKTLVLLYDKVIINSVWFDYLIHDHPMFKSFLEEGYVIPIGDYYDEKYLEDNVFNYKIDYNMFRVGHYNVVQENLASALTYSDFNKINMLPKKDITTLLKDTKLSNEEFPFAYGKLQVILKTINLHLLRSSTFNCPMYIDTASHDIMTWKMNDIVSHFNANISGKVKIAKKFLENISIDIPNDLNVDDFRSFKEDNICRSFRKSILSITERYRERPDNEILDKLIWDYYAKRIEFNEAAQSYAQVRTGILVGLVSTIGGSIGGMSGAAIGGIGASALSYFADCMFKKLYERSHKDWALYLWRWKDK